MVSNAIPSTIGRGTACPVSPPLWELLWWPSWPGTVVPLLGGVYFLSHWVSLGVGLALANEMWAKVT